VAGDWIGFGGQARRRRVPRSCRRSSPARHALVVGPKSSPNARVVLGEAAAPLSRLVGQGVLEMGAHLGSTQRLAGAGPPCAARAWASARSAMTGVAQCRQLPMRMGQLHDMASAPGRRGPRTVGAPGCVGSLSGVSSVTIALCGRFSPLRGGPLRREPGDHHPLHRPQTCVMGTLAATPRRGGGWLTKMFSSGAHRTESVRQIAKQRLCVGSYQIRARMPEHSQVIVGEARERRIGNCALSRLNLANARRSVRSAPHTSACHHPHR
jgi:hypothetical protein